MYPPAEPAWLMAMNATDISRPLLRIGSAQVINELPAANPAGVTVSYEVLFNAALVDVLAEIDRGFRLNAFEWLYSILTMVRFVAQGGSYTIDTAEGLAFAAERLDSAYRVTLTCGTSHRELDLTEAELLLLLADLVHGTAKSLRAAGVDVDRYVRCYPPALW